MIIRAIAGLILTSLLSAGTNAAVVEWKVADGGNGHLYDAVLVGSTITWEDARAAAQARGPGWDLATITSAEENAFVEGLFTADAGFFNCCKYPFPLGRIAPGPWLGATSSTLASNDWTWVTGEAFTFADWGPTAPASNGNQLSYAEMGTARLVAWNDSYSPNPSGPISYIAEFSGTVVPVPAALPLFLSGMGLLPLVARRRAAGA
ncbi:MAG: hypothetical protein ACE5FQ_12365 [Thiogranum sp.]